MDKKVYKKIDKIITGLLPFKHAPEHAIDRSIIQGYETKYIKKQLQKIGEICTPNEFLFALVSKKHNEYKVKRLIETAYFDVGYFKNVELEKFIDKHGQNFIQVAINSGYSTEFIIDMLELFGFNHCNILDCNSVDNNGKNIMHTVAEMWKENDLDIVEIFHTLHKKTDFDDNNFKLKDKNGSSIISYARTFAALYNFNSDKINILYLFIAYFYNLNFELLMKQLGDNDFENESTLKSELMLSSEFTYERNKYNLKHKNQLLYLCVNKKYEDENLVLESIRKILETGIANINLIENDNDFIQVAIKSGYSEKFIYELIELA